METAYPLQWPTHRKRTALPKDGPFSIGTNTPAGVQVNLVEEIQRMNGSSIVISTNIPVRRDGLPYANSAQPEDSGVAVYFQRGKDRVCFACDQYNKVWKNMRAITKTIEAMRGIERWGSKEMLDQAFTGFAALPPPDAPIEMPGPGELPKPWHHILGISETASWNEIRSAYRDKMRDAGEEEKLSINLAYEAAKKIHD